MQWYHWQWPWHLKDITRHVDFSFCCCIIKQLVDSLEQNICWCKTSFHPTTAGLLQVWGRNEIQGLIYVLRGSMCMLRQGCYLSMLHSTCEKLHRVLGWFNGMGVLGWVDGACSKAWTCLSILSHGVLSRTLSHIWSRLNISIENNTIAKKNKKNLPMFLFNVGLLTLM